MVNFKRETLATAEFTKKWKKKRRETPRRRGNRRKAYEIGGLQTNGKKWK